MTIREALNWAVKKLKPKAELTPEQKEMVENGQYRCLSVHPTQLYSSANGLFLCFLLYLFWRRSQIAEEYKNRGKLLIKPGSTFALMLILYGVMRFFLEFLRDDNPFEFDSLTISQNISIAMLVLGIIMMIAFEKAKPEKTNFNHSDKC